MVAPVALQHLMTLTVAFRQAAQPMAFQRQAQTIAIALVLAFQRQPQMVMLASQAPSNWLVEAQLVSTPGSESRLLEPNLPLVTPLEFL